MQLYVKGSIATVFLKWMWTLIDWQNKSLYDIILNSKSGSSLYLELRQTVEVLSLPQLAVWTWVDLNYWTRPWGIFANFLRSLSGKTSEVSGGFCMQSSLCSLVMAYFSMFISATPSSHIHHTTTDFWLPLGVF